MSNKPYPKKVEYRKPELITISLLDESVLGDTFPAEEPPFPMPPGGSPLQGTPGGFGAEPRT